MVKQKEEKLVDVFLVAGKYDPIAQEPSDPRLIMSESDLKLLFTQKPGIQYIPKRWLEHENMQYDLPFLLLRGSVLGIIIPSGELISIYGVRQEKVLLGSLPKACHRCSRHPDLISASKNFDEAWENLTATYADLIRQLEVAKKREDLL